MSVVDDIQRAAKRAEDAEAIRESGCVERNGSRYITFSDPFGHGFCLIDSETGPTGSKRTTYSSSDQELGFIYAGGIVMSVPSAGLKFTWFDVKRGRHDRLHSRC